jgi:hypothetical protein
MRASDQLLIICCIVAVVLGWILTRMLVRAHRLGRVMRRLADGHDRTAGRALQWYWNSDPNNDKTRVESPLSEGKSFHQGLSGRV